MSLPISQSDNGAYAAVNNEKNNSSRPCNSRKCQSLLAYLYNLTAVRPLWFVRHHTLGKVLALIASCYLVVVTCLCFFADDYYSFLPVDPGNLGLSNWTGSSSLESESYSSSSPDQDGSESLDSYEKSYNKFTDFHESSTLLTSPDFDYSYAYNLAMDPERRNQQPFSWSNWVDLSFAEKMVNVTPSDPHWPLKHCRYDEERVFRRPVSNGTEREIASNGKIYLYNNSPKVMRVVVLGENGGFFDVGDLSAKTLLSKREEPNDRSKDESKDVSKEESKKEDSKKEDSKKEESKKEESKESNDDEDLETVSEEKPEEEKPEEEKKRPADGTLTNLDTLKKSLPPFSENLKGRGTNAVQVNMDLSYFKLDLEALKNPKGDHVTDEARAHAKDVALWEKLVPKSKKFFEEVYLYGDPYGYGTHYDWRFFDGVRRGEEHQAIMHHLIRVWAQFVEQEKIMSWIAHGSLLGWFWNGMAMPWDTDNDVQMPIMELDRFARLYNQTLVIQDPKEGTGRYLIDIGPWYVERTRGNAMNVIDARFIDIRSGIYLDITGLAVTGTETTRVNCKNHHYYELTSLSPLRKTLFEGVPVYIPNDFESLLKKEYKNYRTPSYGGWTFNHDMQMWVGKKKCSGFTLEEKKFDSEGNLTLYGACNDFAIWQEYNLTSTLTKHHSDEMSVFYGTDDWHQPTQAEKDAADAATKDKGSKAKSPASEFTLDLKELDQARKEEQSALLQADFAPLRYDPI